MKSALQLKPREYDITSRPARVNGLVSATKAAFRAAAKSVTSRLATGAMLLMMTAPALPAQTTSIAGDYTGTQGGTRVVLHLAQGPDGALSAKTDTPDQGVFGLPCANVSLKDQQLSFSVPQVHGTWAGFVVDNGTKLSGMWNQGSPKPMDFTRVASAAPTQVAAATPQEVQWDRYTFKFIADGVTVQALQGGRLVGTIVQANGKENVIPIGGNDPEALRKSYDDYREFQARSHGATPASYTTGGGTSPSGGSKTIGIRFDDAAKSVTVPQPDGTDITFVGDNIKIGGRYPGTGYLLRLQKASIRRTLERALAHPNTTDGTPLGGGVEYLRESGGILYDSGMGGYNAQEDRNTLIAKQLSQKALDAVNAVRAEPGHADFTPPAYPTLKRIADFKLRSDGSR